VKYRINWDLFLPYILVVVLRQNSGFRRLNFGKKKSEIANHL
jgi:hypothetical protein